MTARSTRRFPLPQLILPLLLFALSPASGQSPTPLPADDPALEVRMVDAIVLNNGNRLEGTIIDDGIEELVFRRTDGIEGRFAQSDIREKIPRNLPEQVYRTRVREYFDAENPADQRALALWCLEEGIDLTPEAIGHLESWAGLSPDDPGPIDLLLPLYAARGRASTEARDRELVTTLRSVREGAGGNGALIHAARLLIEFDDREGAIRLLTPLAEMNASEPAIRDGQDLLVDLLARGGDRDGARALAQRFIADENRGSSLDLLRLSARWLLEDVAAGVPEADTALEETLAAILAEEPEDGRAHLWRGSLALLRGDLPGARDALKRAFELGEFGAEALVTIALALALEGEEQRALDTLASARTAAGVESLVAAIEAYIQERLGDPEFASALLRDAVEAKDASWQTWVLAIQGRSRLDPDFPFDRTVEQALEEVGGNPAAFAELSLLIGDRALSAGKVEDARRWLDYARTTGRPLPELLLRVGLAEMADGGDLRSAREALAEGISLDPDHIDLLNALGALEYREGDLEAARGRFTQVLARLPEKDTTDIDRARRDYAHAVLEQIDRTLREEVWSDDFERPDGSQILNNWDKSENVGVFITLDGGRVRFAGTQAVDQQLTKLTRVVKGSPNHARLRADLTIALGTRARIGIRLTKVEGENELGVVVYRDVDGVLAVALVERDGSEVIRSDAAVEGAEFDGLESEHTIVPTAWPTDGEPHTLELRLPRDDHEEVGASVYLDGKLVMSGIRVPRLGNRGTVVVGISGQAEEGTTYSFHADRFEMYRRKPKSDRGNTPR